MLVYGLGVRVVGRSGVRVFRVLCFRVCGYGLLGA